MLRVFEYRTRTCVDNFDKKRLKSMPKSGKISKQIDQNVIGGGFGGSWSAGSAPGGSGAKALKPKVDLGAEN